MSVTSGMLGMGIAIHLRDLFTRPAERIGRAGDALTRSMVKNQKEMGLVNRQLLMGGGLLAAGTLLGASLGVVGYQAVKADSQLEILRKQFKVLIGDATTAHRAFNQTVRFAAETPFTIPEVAGAARTLLAYGVSVRDLGHQLQVTGDWASFFGKSIEWTSTVIGRIAVGSYGRTYNALRSMGIKIKDLKNFGVPINKDGLIEKGADPGVVLAGLNRYIMSRYGGGMDAIMNTIPGRWSNLQDKMILLMGTVGSRIRNFAFDILKTVEEAMQPEKVEAFATAFGDGLRMIAQGLVWVLTPLALFMKGLMTLSESHPWIVRTATALLGVAAAVLVLGGALLIVMTLKKLIMFSGTGDFLKGLKTGFMSWIPWIFVAGVALLALYAAFKRGDESLVATLRRWYNNTVLVAKGCWELLVSAANGTAYLSEATANTLYNAGLLNIVIRIGMMAYRLYQIVAGAMTTFMGAMSVVGWVLGRVVGIVLWGIEAVASFLSWLGLLGAKVPIDRFKVFGYVLGVVAALLLIYKTYLIAATVWNVVFEKVLGGLGGALVKGAKYLLLLVGGQTAATASTWSFNAALWANPIVWVVGLVILLVAAIVLLAVKFDWAKGKAKQMSDANWVLLSTIAPMVAWIGLAIKHWDRLRSIQHHVAQVLKTEMVAALDTVITYLIRYVLLCIKAAAFVAKLAPAWMLPAGAREALKSAGNWTVESVKAKVLPAMGEASAAYRRQSEFGSSWLKNLDAAVGRMEQASKERDSKRERGVIKLMLDGRKVGEVMEARAGDERSSGR